MLDITDVAIELDVRPLFCNLLVQGLKLLGGLRLVCQVSPICADLARNLLVLLPHLQPGDFPGPEAGTNAAGTDIPLDLRETPLESPCPANTNEVLGCGTIMLVVPRRVLAKNMTTTHPVDVRADLAVPIPGLVQPESESALRVLLHLLGREGYAEKSSEKPPGVMGGIRAADVAHEGWTHEPLQDGLAPFYDSIFDSVRLEKGEDLLGDLVGGIGGGRPRHYTDPNDDRSETPLLLLTHRCLCEEPRWVNERPVDPPSRDQVNDAGTDSFPDDIELGIVDSTESLDWDLAISSTGLGERSCEEVRPVDENRVVPVPGGSIVVRGPLVLGGSVLGDNSDITSGEGKGGRHRRHWGALVLAGHRVDAQQSEN